MSNEDLRGFMIYSMLVIIAFGVIAGAVELKDIAKILRDGLVVR